MDAGLLLLLTAISGAGVLCQLHGVQGPVFLQEPPATLTFSNTSGSQVSCSAHGSPTPQVDWLLQDGNMVTAVPGLRQSLGNGTLYFPPFRAQDYRKDVHSTQYRCRASNLVGTILSRDVNVKAVVRQHYEVQVYRSHVLTGNTAVLSCVIPAHVKDHVTVTSWFRDDSILLPGHADIGGRFVMISGTGDLHIRSARPEDGLVKYSCLTLHSLTHERKRSAPAMLTVTEATGSMPPRLAPRSHVSITVESGSDVHLSCSAQGNPPPNFTWYRESAGQIHAVIPSIRVIPTQDILYIRRVETEDSGRWSCKASNQFGEQRLDTQLTVTAHLAVHVTPQLQVVNSGETATFNCSVTGSPVGSVQWLRNGEPLLAGTAASGARVRLVGPLVLSVGAVTRHDRGMYQCMVRNDRESSQGSAELRLGDTVPELQYTFIEQALRPGPHVSLRCSATGSPPPHFKWLLDGEPLSELSAGHRYAIGQYVDQAGDVISHLNISNVRVEDGGLYSCRAVNSLGSAVHSARLNIYGPPFIRSIGPIQAVAGSDVTLHCPYSGYPISTVRWERRGQELPGDLRHRVEDSQAGGSLIISRVDPVTDSGGYRCTVTSRSGEMAHRDMQLIVHSPPVLEPFGFPSSLQEGGRAQVTCSVTSGDMPIQFTWYKDNAPVSASLQVEERAASFFSMLIFKEVTSRHSGSYTCIASNSAARANYTAQLMVKVAPQWTMEPQDVSTLLGNSVLVNCDAKGFPQPHITWLKGQGKSSMDYQPLENMHGRHSRTVLLANGSMWIEAVGPQDEGHYLCRAANGIGAGLTKVIYIGVNEPARFDTAAKNMSAKRGDPVTLLCQVYGDSPIEVTWSHNGNRIDLNNYRYSITEMKSETGLKSQVLIGRTDREDSGIYRCQAENAYGRSEHLIHLAVQERPDPPVMLEVVEVTSRTVRLTWRRPFDGNSPVLGYLVQYQPLATGHGDWDHSAALNITLPATSVSSAVANNGDERREMAVVKGLTPATAYTIRMLAVNNIDQSPFTDAIVVKTQEEAPVDAPQNLQVKSVGQSELFLSWQVPARETWNGELLGYIVTWNEQGTPINNSKSMTVKGWATTKLQLTSLKKFTRYDVTVRAFNSVSAGPSSIPVVGTTQEGVPEAPPQHVICSKVTSQSMKVSWHPPAPTQHGGLIQGYKVFYRPVATENADVSTSGEIKRTPSTETYLHALHKFTNYSVKVLAYTNVGDGILSSAVYCTTEEDVPGPPASIKAAALTGESILVSWLPPLKPNGRIGVYTVYAREAGRVGQHTSHTVRADDADSVNSASSASIVAAPAVSPTRAPALSPSPALGLMFEVRNLKEHQLYEFWVSATTSVGEGEPTPIVAQATIIKAPSRIASFSQLIARAVKSNVLLPCVAVGNPTPRTRWLHRDRPITFSSFYKVTAAGYLNIHSADPSLAGNYTCSAKNLFGEDEITYTLVVLLPPGQPALEVQYTTANSVKLRWKHADDGGASIQGYTLNSKKGSDDWKTLELGPEATSYTYENLRCGSVYYMFMVAHNRVGNGSPSQLVTVSTKGGPPLIAKDTDLISTNATTLQLNLFTWPNGGCAITQFAIEYRILGEDKWNLISSSASEERLYIQDLMPATWYQLRINAQNDAGVVSSVYDFASTTINGGRIPFPPNYPNQSTTNNYEYKNTFILLAVFSVAILLACGGFFWYSVQKSRRSSENENAQEEEQVDEKTVERDNRRNCQQVYTSSPVKSSDKLAPDDGSGMYEISPYATFSVPGNNSRSVTTSTLDYTMQFKTFGHLENEDHNAIIYPKSGEKRNWHHKHRYYNTDHRIRQQQMRMRGDRGDRSDRGERGERGERTPHPSHSSHRADSESEDTSGSPCNECSGSTATNYRVPVKHSRDMFRLDSSTESNEVSPMTERRSTPRHVGGSGSGAGASSGSGAASRRHDRHRPSSSSSSDDEERRTETVGEGMSGMQSSASSLRLQPPSGFSDSRELSEAECDRDTNPRQPDSTDNKLPVELAALLARYQERKEQERKQFTIHV